MGKQEKETKKKKQQVDYEIIYFWDIETSKVYADGQEEPIQVVFLSNVIEFNMVTGKVTNSVFHRTLDEFITYLSIISNEYREIKVYSHNLSYELEFLLRHTGANGTIREGEKDVYNEDLPQSVLRDRNAPLSIYLDILPYVNFRDSYALFNKSVAQLGKDLIRRGMNLPKLDYDYEKVRLPWDKLEPLDYQYNERDNVIVAYSVYNYLKDNNLSMDKIPLTFTSATKRNRLKFIKENYGEKNIQKLNYKHQSVVEDYDFYNMCIDVYQGGLTTCLPSLLGKSVDMVYSADLKSDYPSQMLRRYFPNFYVDNTYYFEGEEADEFYHEFLHMKDLRSNKSNIKGFMGTFVFDNLEIKSDRYFLPLSFEHCFTSSEFTYNIEKINGKVRKGERVTVRLNDIDLLWLNKAYYYDNIEVVELWLTDRSKQLPLEETSFILKNFDIKENIDKDKFPLEYALSKVNINSMYGVKVQKPIKNRYDIKEGQVLVTDFNNLDLSIKEEVFYNSSDMKKERFMKGGRFGSNFDIFTDGIYITSYARLEIVDIMETLVNEGFIPVYTDTDSIKFTIDKEYFMKKYSIGEKEIIKKGNEVALNLFSRINKEIVKNNSENDRFVQYYHTSSLTEEQYRKILQLGIWEIESEDIDGNISPYPYFKTLGAKKYCYIDNGKIKTTIAGCSKSVAKYIELYADKNNLPYEVALNEVFDNGTLFDKTISGRTSAIKEKRSREECENLTYNKRHLGSYGGIVINNVTYLLNIGEEDSKILEFERPHKPIRKLNDKGELKYYEYELED